MPDEEKGAAPDASPSGTSGDPTTPPKGETTFEEWSEKLKDEERSLLEGHTSKLKTALESERKTRKELSERVRDLTKQAEDGSKTQAELQKISDQLTQYQRRVAVYDSAPTDLINFRLAGLLIEAENLYDPRGGVDWDTVRKQAPELFRKFAPPGNAGTGLGAGPQKKPSMNDLIRRAAGRS